jgi:hypothetical protein
MDDEGGHGGGWGAWSTHAVTLYTAYSDGGEKTCSDAGVNRSEFLPIMTIGVLVKQAKIAVLGMLQIQHT